MSKLGCNPRYSERNGWLVKSSKETIGNACRRRNIAAREEMNFWFLPGSLSFIARQADNKQEKLALVASI